MKKTIAIVCAVLVLAFCLTACGGKGDISGTYKLVEMTSQGQDMTSYLEIVGEVLLIISGDKAQITMGGETTTMTVDTSKGILQDSTGASTPYTIEGNRLTMENTTSQSKMVFEKITSTQDSKATADSK